MSVDDTLAERGSRYGDFSDHAEIAQRLQNVMRGPRTSSQPHGWDRLSDVQKQALTVIADKIARILSGDPDYVDNWHDIQGYARLVEERLTPGFAFKQPDGWDKVSVTIVDEKGKRPYVPRPSTQAICACKYPNPASDAKRTCLNCGGYTTI